MGISAQYEEERGDIEYYDRIKNANNRRVQNREDNQTIGKYNNCGTQFPAGGGSTTFTIPDNFIISCILITNSDNATKTVTCQIGSNSGNNFGLILNAYANVVIPLNSCYPNDNTVYITSTGNGYCYVFGSSY